MAKKETSTSKAVSSAGSPPAELLALVESFLERNSFKKALDALKKQRGSKENAAAPADVTLELLYTKWKTGEAKPAVTKKAKEDSSDSDSDSDSSDKSSSSSSESNSDSEDEDEDMDDAPKAPSPAAGKQPLSLKRKAESSSDESSDDSSSESEPSSSDDEPQAKKQKTASAPAVKKKADSSDSDSSSEESSESESSSSESSSDESSSDDSSSESAAETKAAAKVPLPESDSSSSSDDSSSDSDSDAPTTKKDAPKKDCSDSSATLDNPPLPPNPTITQTNGRKKTNEPFSRIPKDIVVDPRFASNAYVPMSYSQRAHEDLIVTKGKGFTKEKNKKKKGSFRGGAIDISEKKGIYFD